MGEQQPSEGRSGDHQTEPERKSTSRWNRLGSRAKTIVLGAVAAVLAGIGLGVSDLLQTEARHATHLAEGVFVPASDDGPLLVHVVPPGTFYSGNPAAPYYIVPRSRVTKPPKLNGADQADAHLTDEVLDYPWVRRHGGYAGSPEVVRLELISTGGPVVINRIAPILVSSHRPLNGWFVDAPACGAAQVWVAHFDLDKRSAPAGYVNISGASQHALALQVTKSKPTIVELWATTRRAAVGWEARIFYSAGAEDETAVVNDAGRPFMVSSPRNSVGYRRAYGGHGPQARRMPEWDKTGPTSC